VSRGIKSGPGNQLLERHAGEHRKGRVAYNVGVDRDFPPEKDHPCPSSLARERTIRRYRNEQGKERVIPMEHGPAATV